MDSEPFVGKPAVKDISRDLYHYRDVVSSKEKFWICKSCFTIRVTYRHASPCPANDVPLHQLVVAVVAFLKLVGRCNGISLVGHGDTFRWITHVVKTLLHIQNFSFDGRTSLRRTVGSQPSNTILVLFWILTSPWQNTCYHAFPEVEIGTAVSASIELIILVPSWCSPWWFWPPEPPKSPNRESFGRTRKSGS